MHNVNNDRVSEEPLVISMWWEAAPVPTVLFTISFLYKYFIQLYSVDSLPLQY